MHDRDRSDRSALVASVCTAIVFLIGLWAGGYHYERQQEYASQSHRPDLHLIEGDPESYQAICDAPHDEVHADLCQQWRAAEAATNAAGWTQAQFWIGFAGLVGLIATVTYAIRAFRQTTIQAKAALRANARATIANVIARDNAKADQRPWAAVEILSVQQQFGPSNFASIRIGWRLTNHGRFPAIRGRMFWNFVRAGQNLDAKFSAFIRQCASEYHAGGDVHRATIVFPNAQPESFRDIDEVVASRPKSVATNYHIFLAFFYRSPSDGGAVLHSGQAIFVSMKPGDMESDDFTYTAGDEARDFYSTGVVSIS